VKRSAGFYRIARRLFKVDGPFVRFRNPIHPTDTMTPHRTLLASALALTLVSCANQQTSENYDTPASPYGPAAAGYADATPYQSTDAPVNPAYDTPAAYDDSTVVRPPFDAGPAPTAPSGTPAAGGAATVHTVVSGDTLWGLSRQYGVSIDAIKAANNMTRDVVVLGQRLQIPGR
jgi:LysM repeat protein